MKTLNNQINNQKTNNFCCPQCGAPILIAREGVEGYLFYSVFCGNPICDHPLCDHGDISPHSAQDAYNRLLERFVAFNDLAGAPTNFPFGLQMVEDEGVAINQKDR